MSKSNQKNRPAPPPPPPPPQEKVVKKKSGCLLPLLLLLLLIALLIFLIWHFGWFGFGDGDGSGSSGSGASSSTSESQEIEKNDNINDKVITNVTVNGDEYLYDNQPVELDKLIDIIKETEGDVTVDIADSDSTKNALDALVNRLADEKISYIDNSSINETEAE